MESHAPRSARLLLGARWSFGLPLHHRRGELHEYSFPLNPTDFLHALAARTGVVIEHHPTGESGVLYDYLREAGAAIVAVDSFFLPYRPAFSRVHSNRTIIVKCTSDPSQVWVEDSWPPSYRGPLLVSDLERARHSSVPRVPHLEPVFSGHAIGGEWFSVEVKPICLANPRDWAVSILWTLLAEASTSTVNADAQYGPDAVRQLIDNLSAGKCSSPEERDSTFQEAALLLRTELSARVYLCSLLQACAGWIHNPTLERAVFRYSASLSHLEMARDILIKATRCEDHPLYRACITGGLCSFRAAEERLIRLLEDQLEKLLQRPSRMQSNNSAFPQGDLYA